MVERIFRQYSPLFELKLLHHYWLDDGNVQFDSLTAKQQTDRLRDYDIRNFLDVKPTATTEKLLKNLTSVCKYTTQGCIVTIPTNVVPLADTIFNFVVTVKDVRFFNYTALTLPSRKIHEFSQKIIDPQAKDQPPKIIKYRYKENVPVFSNLTGATRTKAGIKTLFLSKDFPAPRPDDKVESFAVSGTALVQLTSDQPSANTQQLNAQFNDSPVYMNQADIPAIVPPNQVTGVPAKGIELSSEIPEDVFAVIQLSANRADDVDFSLIGRPTNSSAKYPTFYIHFKSRSTIWQYFKKDSMELAFSETDVLPLTYFGNAGKKERPKPSDYIIQVNKAQNGGKVTQLVSKIFM